MLDRSKVVKLSQVANYLSYMGVYAIESEVKGVLYGYQKNHLVIFTLKGDVAIKYKDIPDLIKWLKSIKRTGYVPVNVPIYFGIWKNQIIIGQAVIFKSRLPGLIEELEGICEDLHDRKRMGVKGA
jgi:hypothetical protein